MNEADNVFNNYFNKVKSESRNRKILNNKFTYESLYINLKKLGLTSKDINETDYCNLIIAVKNIWNCIKDNI